MNAVDNQPTHTSKRKRLRPVLAKGSGIGISPIELAQKLLPVPERTSLGIVPGDGDCFFHCVRRGLRVETPLAVLRGLAGCPACVWADDSHIAKLCTELNFRVASNSVDIDRAHAGWILKTCNCQGPCVEWTLNIVSWTRGMRVGLRSDLLEGMSEVTLGMLAGDAPPMEKPLPQQNIAEVSEPNLLMRDAFNYEQTVNAMNAMEE